MDPITYQTPRELSLEVRIPAGVVTVRTGDVDQTTLRISGEKTPDEISVRFADRSDGTHHLVVRHRKSGPRRWQSAAVTVEVEAPEHTRVTVEGGATDLSVHGRLLAASFLSGSGDATLDTVDDQVDVKVASGSLRAGVVDGMVTFHSASGTLQAEACRGGLVARAASGNLVVGEAGGDLRLTTLSGDVRLGAVGPGTVSANATSGDVSIGVVPGIDLYLDLSSTAGSASSDLPLADLPTGTGQRTLAITASSMSGNVRVYRAAARGTAA